MSAPGRPRREYRSAKHAGIPIKALTAARYWTLAPALLLFVAVALVPIGELVAMSLARIDWVQGKAQWHFVGFEQYARVLRDALFRTGVANTIVFAVSAVLIIFDEERFATCAGRLLSQGISSRRINDEAALAAFCRRFSSSS